MKHITNENDSFSNFTIILRILSGQDVEPEFVLVEHAYALPLSSRVEKNVSRPLKTLFFNKLSPSDSTCGSNEDNVDGNSNSAPRSAPVLYDHHKGCILMNESERHVNSKLNLQGTVRHTSIDDTKEQDAEEEDWEEKINKIGWSENQKEIFSSAVSILNGHYLARLSLQGTRNEPLKRRVQTDLAAGRLRQVLGTHRWDMRLCTWLHNTLLHNLNKSYLASYIDILQTLNSQIPSLVERMVCLPPSYKGPIIEDLNLFLKRPWDPVSTIFSKFKPNKIDSPIVIQVPSGLPSKVVPHISRRLRFFNTQMQNMVKFVSVSVTSDLTAPDDILSFIASETRTKIVECKAQYPSRPVILLGWGVGASLAANISLIEKVSGLICLGFPLMDHEGIRGDGDDPLLDLTTPALFVFGSKATDANVENFEYFRHQLLSPSSLIQIDGADSHLRISNQKCYHDSITQSIVDRCIVDEIGNFLKLTLNDGNNNNKTRSSSSFINPLPPRVPRKRKFSPSNDITEVVVVKPAESRLSQNLGLKIPVAAAINMNKIDKQQVSTATSLITGLELPTDSDLNKLSSSVVENTQLGFKPLESVVSKSSQFDGSSSSATQSLTTISLGSLASLSRQKYQKMMQMSENAEPNLPNNASIIQNWKPPSVSSSETLESACLTSTVSSSSSALPNRASASSNIEHNTSSEKADLTSQPVVKFHSTYAKPVEVSNVLVTSSVRNTGPLNKPKRVLNRRGRPRGRHTSHHGATNTVSLNRPKPKGALTETQLAVLTLTGEGEAGNDSTEKGISSLGRGVLTLSRGGTSAVRVYSASSYKANTSTSSTSVPKNTLHFTNITSRPSDRMPTYQVSNKFSNNSPALRRLSNPSPLALQGISAARTVVPQRGGIALSRANTSTVVYLTNSISTGATTTTTTISSGGVKTTKSIVGTQHPLVSLDSRFEPPRQDQFRKVITVQGSNTIHIPELLPNEEPQSELDILAAAATELYKKENLTKSHQTESIMTEPTLKLVNTKPINKPLLKYISPTPKRTSAIRLIKPATGRTFLKTTAVGTTSTGKIITRTFSINPSHQVIATPQNRQVNLGGAFNDSKLGTTILETSLAPKSKVVISTNTSSIEQIDTKQSVKVSSSIGIDKSLMGSLTALREKSKKSPVIKVTTHPTAIKLKQTAPLIKVATINMATQNKATTSSASLLASSSANNKDKKSETNTESVSSDAIKLTDSKGIANITVIQPVNSKDSLPPKPMIKVSTNTPVTKAIITKPLIKVSTLHPLSSVITSKEIDINIAPVRTMPISRRSLVECVTRSVSKSPVLSTNSVSKSTIGSCKKLKLSEQD